MLTPSAGGSDDPAFSVFGAPKASNANRDSPANVECRFPMDDGGVRAKSVDSSLDSSMLIPRLHVDHLSAGAKHDQINSATSLLSLMLVLSLLGHGSLS